jgi:hypothetical protein
MVADSDFIISFANLDYGCMGDMEGPQLAARLAEGLRSAAARAERRDDLKRWVFMTLMQQRRCPTHYTSR